MKPDFPETNIDLTTTHWAEIINFYTEHRDSLTEAEILDLHTQSETCRKHFNSLYHNSFHKCKEDEVSSDLYPRARQIKNKFGGGVTSAHSIAN